MDGFKIDYLVNGEEVLLRNVQRQKSVDAKDGYKWLPVVALEELRELLQQHNERALLFKCSKKLFHHVGMGCGQRMRAPGSD